VAFKKLLKDIFKRFTRGPFLGLSRFIGCAPLLLAPVLVEEERILAKPNPCEET
jgi:hypothetical protein